MGRAHRNVGKLIECQNSEEISLEARPTSWLLSKVLQELEYGPGPVYQLLGRNGVQVV